MVGLAKRHLRRLMVAIATVGVVSTLGAGSSRAAGDRYMLRLTSPSAATSARAALERSGIAVIEEIPELGVVVVRSDTDGGTTRSAIRALGTLIPDRIVRVSPPEGSKPRAKAPGLLSARRVSASLAAAPRAAIRPDPALSYRGLLWDFERIGLPAGWARSAGDPTIVVGVADTGLDFTHVDLKPSIVRVQDFTVSENPPLCDPSDQDYADYYGGPAKTDWNGHGSWIGGNIAGALNGTGINGIAPKVKLVALKIAQNCGYAYDSTILKSFVWAAKNGVDIVSISFGGYLDRTDPKQDADYGLYVDAVRLARSKGMLIVAAAGNEHVRLGTGGKVLSHGSLTRPGDPVEDLFGLYEVPGGVPGVVTVSSTGNRTIPSSAYCPWGTGGSPSNRGDYATCKPRNDRHQAPGQSLTDQLAYYSNYGPRIDVAAPGGARKFNLPYWDRGGTPGFPYVGDDLTNAWEEFSTTSNWSAEIDCFIFTKGSGFTPNQCYSTIQGTSMATPHVSAVLALIASAQPALRGKPDRLVAALKAGARSARNLTQVLSATDKSKGDLTGVACGKGYCHLGGATISNSDAYGAGIVVAPQPSSGG
ncbi:MAG: S8 family serine peptidase [Geminicoccaceae bacterium]